MSPLKHNPVSVNLAISPPLVLVPKIKFLAVDVPAVMCKLPVAPCLCILQALLTAGFEVEFSIIIPSVVFPILAAPFTSSLKLLFGVPFIPTFPTVLTVILSAELVVSTSLNIPAFAASL